MQWIQQIVFTVSLLALCWLAMMAVHELGHVAGAWATGGSVQRVVLHPLSISRTDVAPNPRPGWVVWMGPLIGCVLPIGTAACVPGRRRSIRKIAWFFAGFCLTANGAYIAFGTLGHVGDCSEMLRTGTPPWAMWAFGAVANAAGTVDLAPPRIAQELLKESIARHARNGACGVRYARDGDGCERIKKRRSTAVPLSTAGECAVGECFKFRRQFASAR